MTRWGRGLSGLAATAVPVFGAVWTCPPRPAEGAVSCFSGDARHQHPGNRRAGTAKTNTFPLTPSVATGVTA